MRPRLLDLFCCAGGAAMGYHRAGFDVVGVDIEPQPNYPFDFVQADALECLRVALDEGGWPGECRFDAIHAIHASPPCQAHVKGMRAANEALGRELGHVDLIPPTRELLRSTGLPYVIENVIGAPLVDPVLICGSMFDPVMTIRRHRLFETNWHLEPPMWPCRHKLQQGDYWTSAMPGGRRTRAKVVQVYGQAADRHLWPDAMGVDWMTYDELAEAIPPAYTEHIGRQLLAHIDARVAA